MGFGPPYHGNRTRFRSIVREASRIADVHIAGLNMPADEYAGLSSESAVLEGNFRPNILKRIRRKLARLAGLPINEHKPANVLDSSFDAGIHSRMRKHFADRAFDAVIVSYTFNSAYISCFAQSAVCAIDTIDVLSDRKSMLDQIGVSGSSAWFSCTQREEAEALSRADAVIAIQRNEMRHFEKLSGMSTPVHLVSYLDPPIRIPRVPEKEVVFGIISSDNLINVKSMEWFLASVWKPFCELQPNARLMIAGGICSHVPPGTAGIELLGSLSETQDFYARVDVCLNPSVVGTGLKIKTIEAMAAGRAVVGTKAAADGLEECDGNGLVIAPDAPAFIEAMQRMNGNHVLCNQWGDSAHAFVNGIYADSVRTLHTIISCPPDRSQSASR